MSLTVNSREISKQDAGQNGRICEEYELAWGTTSTSGTLSTSLQIVTGASMVIIGTPASDEVISLNEAAHVSKGKIVVASKTITVIRTGASPTSGLQFFLRLFGW